MERWLQESLIATSLESRPNTIISLMPNQDLDATWKYHNGTTHSIQPARASTFSRLGRKPLLFRIAYPRK